MNINEINQAPYNPRKMSKEAATGLAASMEEFNDISGIVFNKRTKNLVSGNHRFKLLKKIFGKLKPKRLDDTDIYLLLDGEGESTGFTMKVVDWEVEKEMAANIAANAKQIQGEFTDRVSDMLQEIADSQYANISERLRLPEIKLAFKDVKFDIPSLKKSIEVEQVSDQEIKEALEDDEIEFDTEDSDLTSGDDIKNFKAPELPPYTNLRIKIPTDKKSQVISAFSSCLEDLEIKDFSIG
jgi:hypothetical protein